jgi:hypothetical protein
VPSAIYARPAKCGSVAANAVRVRVTAVSFRLQASALAAQTVRDSDAREGGRDPVPVLSGTDTSIGYDPVYTVRREPERQYVYAACLLHRYR